MQEFSVNDGGQRPDKARGRGGEGNGVERALKVEDRRKAGFGEDVHTVA